MRWLALLVVVPGLVGVGWLASDRLERRNDFCTSCHLPDGSVLHGELREDFDRVIPVSLAGVHGRGWVEDREDTAMRCIDCHGGSGPGERVLIKLLAARDALRYVGGNFEEPDGMPFDLSADTCRRCHPEFRGSAAPGWPVRAYHGVAAHDEHREAPTCVGCHTVHDRGGDGLAYHMTRERVDRHCRACHSEDARSVLSAGR